MDSNKPIMNMGQTRWYKSKSRCNLCYRIRSCYGHWWRLCHIQVFELSVYEQVAEWRHNTTHIAQIRILTDIAKYIQQETGSANPNILECRKQ